MEKDRKLDSAMVNNIIRLGMVIFRVAIGIVWFSELLWKLPPTFGCPPNFTVTTSISARTTGLCDWIGIMTLYSRWPLQASLVKSLVVPNIAWMGWIIWLAEAFVAVSLILGLFTRLGGLLGFVQAINLLIGVSAAPGETIWLYVFLAVTALFFVVVPAGRFLGLDAWLRPRLQAGAERKNRLARILLSLT
jgi:hypothetical protein